MISQVRLSWTHYNSSLIFQIHRSAIATPGLSPLGRGGYILLSPSRLVTTAPEGIGALSGFPYFSYRKNTRPGRAPDGAIASLQSPSRLATTVPGGIGPYVYRSQNKTQAGEQANRPLNKL